MKYVIFLGGKQGSGKSSAATEIERVCADVGLVTNITKYAEALYRLHDVVQDFFEQEMGIEKQKKHGPLLQQLGTNIGRNLYGEDVWTRWMVRRIKSFFSHVSEDQPAVIIIEDVRFRNELEVSKLLKEEGYETLSILFEAPFEVRKSRVESFRVDVDHPSEKELDSFSHEFDHRIETSGDEKDKSEAIKALLKQFIKPVPPEKYIEAVVQFFNEALLDVQTNMKITANFGWTYDTKTGLKKMTLLDVGPVIATNTEELKKAAEAHTPALEAAAELQESVQVVHAGTEEA